ncbi:MAG: Lrp/AsnC family transcriptional regulator [Methyloligellaceae bacterium]
MMELDRIDRKILQELELDGRISNTELAQRVGLSASACLRRVQELEKQKVILGYRAVLDRSVMGGGFIVYVAVGLSRHLKEDQMAFERAMAIAPEVRECHNVSGTIEYMLRVEVSDLNAYKNFHTEVLGTVSQVSSITSYICMASPKDERG